MNVHFQALPDHAERIANIVVRIQKKLLRKYMQHHAILGQGDIARRVHGVANIVAVNIPGTVAQGDSAAAVHSANVTSCHACNRALHGHMGDALGFFDRAPHGGRRGADIRNQAFAQAFRFGCAHRDEFHVGIVHFADDGARLRTAHVERHNIFALLCQPAAPSRSSRQAGDASGRETWKIPLMLLPHGFRVNWRAMWNACGHRADFRIHHHLPRKPQIHRVNAAGSRAPLVDIFRKQTVPVAEIRIAEVYKNRGRIASAEPNPVSVACKSAASERSTSLT